jgi:cation transport ATPase
MASNPLPHPPGGPAAGGGQGNVALGPLTAWEAATSDSDNRKVIVDAANAILIGASLIASVTYASWLILPYDGIVHKKAVKVFWAFNSLSFFFAVATVLGCASAAMPNFNTATSQNMFFSMLLRLRVSSFFFITSVVCVLGAFTSAAFVRVPNQQDTYFIHDAIIVTIIAVGSVFSLAGMGYFILVMLWLNH